MYNKNFIKKPTEKQKIGEIGENSVCKYLVKHGFIIVERNYLKKWGELDIVTERDGILHFIEVKSKTGDIPDVTHETRDSIGDYRPEDNMHKWKQERLNRAVESYLVERNVSDETEWQFDLATVVIDKSKRQSYVSILEDIIIG